MRIRFVMTVLMLLGLGGALKVNAQNWTGNAPSNGLEAVLYNVGTGCYINSDNLWGAQVYLKSSGQFFTLSGSSLTYKLMNGSANAIGWGAGNSGESSELYTTIKSGGIAYQGQQIDFTFNAVSGKTNVYTISCKVYGSSTSRSTVYLTSGGKDNAVATTTTAPTDEAGQWMLVTKTQMQTYFAEVATATKLNETVADGTYLITTPGFGCRESGLSYWKTSESGKTLADLQPAWNGTGILKPSTSTGIVVGNGYYGTSVYGDGIVEGDETLFTDPEDGTKCEKMLGGLWTANIHGTGKVYQEVTVTASGWYEISCKGLTTGTANLFANTTSAREDKTLFPSSATATLVTPTEVPASYALAATELKNNTETYRKSVQIYVELNGAASATITIGVEETGESGWACFDDFELKYFGADSEAYLYFDEDNTSVDDLKAQTSNEKHTLYLHRSLKSGQWNSLLLPVTLNRDNIRATFGENTILSELVGVDENNDYLINFKKVDLDDASSQLQAGKLYIIKPQGTMDVIESKEYQIKRVDNTASQGYKEITIEASTTPIIRILNVVFTADGTSAEGFWGTNGIVTMTGYNHGNALASLSFMGSYVKNETNGVIPAGSFVLGASNGKWYHTTSDINSIKGFRSWLDASEVPAEPLAKLSFCFNGVQDGGVTAIDGVEISKPATPFSQNVYDLNGRIVNTKGNVDGLAKGIYIVNGKKVVIK